MLSIPQLMRSPPNPVYNCKFAADGVKKETIPKKNLKCGRPNNSDRRWKKKCDHLIYWPLNATKRIKQKKVNIEWSLKMHEIFTVCSSDACSSHSMHIVTHEIAMDTEIFSWKRLMESASIGIREITWIGQWILSIDYIDSNRFPY